MTLDEVRVTILTVVAAVMGVACEDKKDQTRDGMLRTRDYEFGGRKSRLRRVSHASVEGLAWRVEIWKVQMTWYVVKTWWLVMG